MQAEQSYNAVPKSSDNVFSMNAKIPDNVGGPNSASVMVYNTSYEEENNNEEENEEEDSELISGRVTDPFVARPPKFKMPRIIWITLAVLPMLSFSLLFICLGFDLLGNYLVGTSPYGIYQLLVQLLAPTTNPANTKKILTPILLLLGVGFGLVLSMIGLVLDLAKSRFSGSIASIISRDNKVVSVIGLVVLANVFGFFTFMTMSYNKEYSPRSAVNLIVILVICLTFGTFPFMAYLFFFLDPQKVVTKIVMNGLQGVFQSVEDSDGHNVDIYQAKAITSIDHLVQAAYGAIKKKDKNIAAKSVDALCSFALHYGRLKKEMFLHWYFIPVWIRQSSDFLTVPDESITDLVSRKTWLEWKIFRQYLLLFNESMDTLKEVCYHVAMNTRIIAEATCAPERADMHTLDLAIKFFNTYIRAAINKATVHTVYIILFQYRKLGESLINYAKELKRDKTYYSIGTSLEDRVLQIAKYMRYYSAEVFNRRLFFLVEVIAHDIRVLCETACEHESVIHDKLLDVFMTVFDANDPSHPEAAIKGMRRAQICLATCYLGMEKTSYARKIYDDFVEEKPDRLAALFKELNNVTNREFFEVSERGTNFTFIPDEQKLQLPVFFSWFEKLPQEQFQIKLSTQKSARFS